MNITIDFADKGKINLFMRTVNDQNPKPLVLNFDLDKGKYVRFVPLICLRVPEIFDGKDFAYFAEGDCRQMTLEKTLLGRKMDNSLAFMTSS